MELLRTNDRLRIWRGVALLGIVAATAACGGGPAKPSTSSFSSITARPSSPAKVTILSPTPNQVVKGKILQVRLKLEDAKLVQKTSANISPTTGHIHVSIDGKIKSLLAGLSYPADISDLAAGRHLLQVEFVAADHGVFNPRVIVTQTFEVKK